MPKLTRKCNYCGLNDTHMDEMVFRMSKEKKPRKLYYHKGECWENYLKQQTFIDKENKEKDKLNEVLKRIYGVPDVPSPAWALLEKLRGGNRVFGAKQQIGKRYKEGYSYPLITETFEYCSDTIEYWNSVKDFDGFMGAFRYALTIVIDKLYFVEQREKEREKKQIMMKKHIEQVEEFDQSFESSYKKPSKKNADITDFLDD